MAEENQNIICAPAESAIKIHKWKVREGYPVTSGNIILFYELPNGPEKDVKRLKATKAGVVKKRLAKEGEIVDKGYVRQRVACCFDFDVFAQVI